MIARELEAARSHVRIAGCFFPDFALCRGERPVVLRHLLGELAERVEVRVSVGRSAVAAVPAVAARGREDARRPHQAVPDQVEPRREGTPYALSPRKDDRDRRSCAFVGGIDLATQAGDHFDSSEHPARDAISWRDATAWIEGPAVSDVAERSDALARGQGERPAHRPTA